MNIDFTGKRALVTGAGRGKKENQLLTIMRNNRHYHNVPPNAMK